MNLHTENRSWTLGTIAEINKLTPEISGKAFDPGWFSLRQRFEQMEDERDHLRTQLKSLEGDCAVMRSALEVARCALVKSAVLLEKNNGQHGESASWNGKDGTNRAAWMILENDAIIEEIASITKGIKP